MRKQWFVIVALVLFISTIISPYYTFAQHNNVMSTNNLTPANENEKLTRALSTTSATYTNDFLTNVTLYTADKTEVTDGGEIDRTRNFSVRYDWTLPDGKVKEGETLIVELPKELRFTEDYTQQLKHEGAVVGEAVLSSEDGTIVITFTDYAETHNGVTLYFEAGVSINSFELPTNGPKTITFEAVGGDYTHSFELVGFGTSRDEILTKYNWGYNHDRDTINWTVRVNLAKENLKNVIVNDELDEGHEIVEDSIKIYLKQFDFPVGAADPKQISSEEISAEDYNKMLTVDNDKLGFTVNFGDLNGETYVIDYETRFTGDNIIKRENVRNTATLKHDDGEKTSYGQYEYSWVGGGATGFENADVIVRKVDEDGKPITLPATFALYNENGAEHSANYKTNEDGLLAIENLTPGNYYLVETEAPIGYEREVDKKYPFAVQAGVAAPEITIQNSEILTEVHVTKTWDDANNANGMRPTSIHVNLLANNKVIQTKEITAADDWRYTFSGLPKYEDGKEIEYSITEEAVSGYTSKVDGYHITNSYTPEVIAIEGTKTWDDANNEDGKRPMSITVNVVAKNQVVQSKTVTAADDWQYTFSGLPKYENGELIVYSVTEEPVANYEVTVDGYNLINTYTPSDIPPSPVVGAVTLTKVDADNATTKLANAVFELKQGTTVIQSNLKTDANGQVTVSDLAPGEYEFVEVTAPAGYTLDAKPLKVSVKSGETATVTMSNKKIPPPVIPPGPVVGAVTLTKVDADNATTKLANAVFELKQGTTVIQSQLKTDANGQVTVSDLAPGEYEFVEVTAPAGYELNKTPVKVVVKSDTHTTITITNRKMPVSTVYVEATKVDGTTNALLAGATFQLYKQNNIGTYEKVSNAIFVTGTDGKLKIGELAVGKYRLVETIAPKGYVKLTAPVAFDITTTDFTRPNNKVELPAIKNFKLAVATEKPTTTAPTTNKTPATTAKPTQVLPQTSGGHTLWTSVFGMLLLLSAVGIFFVRRQRA